MRTGVHGAKRRCVLAGIAATLLASVVCAAPAAPCSIERRPTADGKATIFRLENAFLQVNVNPQKDGGIDRLFYKPNRTLLTIPIEQDADTSFLDRIYRQITEGDGTVIETEYFNAYEAPVEVLADGPGEVSIRASCPAKSSAFAGLVVHKTYTLRRDRASLVIEHALENTSAKPMRAGIWVTTFLRSSGMFPERNSYYSPTPRGVQVVTHPGLGASNQGDWVQEPPAGWRAILGRSSRTGIVTALDLPYVSAYYDWYRKDMFVSTFEWMIREQGIAAGQTFKTRYVLMPVQEFKRVDGVVAGRIPVGISLDKRRIEPGDVIEAEIRLSAPERENVTVKVGVVSGSGAPTWTEVLSEDITLDVGQTSVHRGVSFPAPGEGAYALEVRILKGGKVLGSVSRPFVVGDAELPAKTIARKAEPVGEKLLYPVFLLHLDGYKRLKFRAVTGVKKVAKQPSTKTVKTESATREAHEARARQMYPPLDIFFSVNEDHVTPHVRWNKPSAAGKVKVLYLAQMKWTVDTVKRNVVELRQRMDMDYTFVPLLKRVKTFGGSNGMHYDQFGKGLEPYIMDVLQEEMAKDHEVVVVHKLDFKAMEAEFVRLILDAAAAGKGVVLIDCPNLPAAIQTVLEANKAGIPDHFLGLPKVNPALPVRRAMSNICTLATHGKGRIASLTTAKRFYPCVPQKNRGESSPDYDGRGIPYWEYMHLPMMKTLTWAAGQAPVAAVNAMRYADGAIQATISGSEVGAGRIEVRFRDEYGAVRATRVYPADLRKGKSEVAMAVPELVGGLHLADYRLIDAKGAVHDYGSFCFAAPAAVTITSVTFDKAYYEASDTVTATIALGGTLPLRTRLHAEPAVRLVVEVEDTYGRIVHRVARPFPGVEKDTRIRFRIEHPLTILHRVTVSVTHGERVLARKMGEFSLPFNFPPDDEMQAYVWYGQAQGLKRWKDVGFDGVVTSFGKESNGQLRALCNMNLRPWSYGMGYIAGSPAHKGDSHYFGPDEVREPCFSDPARWQKIRARAMKSVETHTYYGVFEYQLTDELYLGPNFCFSPHCSRDFRSWLTTRYGSLAALNASWETEFATWDEVKPPSTTAVSADDGDITSWVDHRMFMNFVFARWVARNKGIIRERNPYARMGLSGTGNPDTTYNWWDLMKHVDFLASYGGIQENLIASFAKGGYRVSGWTGGYAAAHVNAEKYERSVPWMQLFGGSNAYFFFHGSQMGTCMLGDLSLHPNLQTGAREVREIKNGVDKLLLSSARAHDGIAVHYSQNSLFVCDALFGSQFWANGLDSWKFLLDDMGLTFRFVSYEQLADRAPDPAEYKVFVLPMSVSLSGDEIENLRRYVREGGVLVADYAPGLRDEHGKRVANADLLEIFGVERKRSDVRMQACEMKVRGHAGHGLTERTVTVRYGEEGLRLAGGEAFGDSGNPNAPAVIINRFGKGKAVLINGVIGDYAQVKLGGGGETTLIGRGDPAITTPMRELVADILAGAGVTRKVHVRTATGEDFQPLTRTVRYTDGEIEYVGILRHDARSEPIKESEYVPARIAFGRRGHVYDVRKGAYLGRRSEIETSIAPAVAQLYAILPYRMRGVRARARGRFAPGDVVAVSVRVRGRRSKMGGHVFHVEVIGPDNEPRPWYAQDVKVSNGRGEIRIPTALNDAPGRWTVRLRDVASGVKTEAGFVLGSGKGG